MTTSATPDPNHDPASDEPTTVLVPPAASPAATAAQPENPPAPAASSQPVTAPPTIPTEPPPATAWQPQPGAPSSNGGPAGRRSVARWFGTRTGVGVLVAALMLVFAVVPVGVLGFAVGRHTGGAGHHERFDRQGDTRHGWQRDEPRRENQRWNDDDSGTGPGQLPFRPGQRLRIPGQQGAPGAPSPTATPSSPGQGS